MSTPRETELEIANTTLQSRIVQIGADNAALRRELIHKSEVVVRGLISKNSELREALRIAVNQIRAHGVPEDAAITAALEAKP